MLNKIFSYIIHPSKIILFFASKNIIKISDERFLKMQFKIMMGKDLNLENPKTFSEKLQWLKLYDRKDIYTKLVDKYQVKDYIKEKIGEKYVIPTLGIYNSFKEIDFDKLPNQFVMKCTHDSGGVVIVKDKNDFDKEKARKKLEKSLKKNFFYVGREWPYKNVKPRIIIEKYFEDRETEELRDYKFFCFNGKPEYLFVATDRNKAEETKFDFFDMNYHHLDVRNGHPNASVLPQKPSQFEKMKELAAILSKNIPQVRIDFYEVDGKIFFGEFTFFHWGGTMPFEPEDWDIKFGDLITLPRNYK